MRNFSRYARLPPKASSLRACSVLIPARDEAANIGAALRSVLRSRHIDLEVIVLDDHSRDATARIVREIAARDARVRLEQAAALPDHWVGKNFACHQLAAFATHSRLIFLDADVRVTREDSLARLLTFLEQSNAGLVSGVPRQITGGMMEKMVVPLIHFILLGFLSLRRMRKNPDPRFAAACGQILAVRRDAYVQTGGHAAIAGRMHDALALARHFRAQGVATDLFDGTDTFRCRMYHRAAEVWHGFAKNAHEGLAAPALILPATLLLAGGQILPLLLLLAAPSAFTVAGTLAMFLPRLLAAQRFHQSFLGVLLHPIGVALLLAIQWSAFLRARSRRPAVWKGRAYPTLAGGKFSPS